MNFNRSGTIFVTSEITGKLGYIHETNIVDLIQKIGLVCGQTGGIPIQMNNPFLYEGGRKVGMLVIIAGQVLSAQEEDKTGDNDQTTIPPGQYL